MRHACILRPRADKRTRVSQTLPVCQICAVNHAVCRYGPEVDWWTFGILMYELLTGTTPFSADTEQNNFDNILKCSISFPNDVTSSVEVRSLITMLLEKNPKKRLGSAIDAAAIKTHFFFQSMNWEKLVKKELTPPMVPDCEFRDHSNTKIVLDSPKDAKFTQKQKRVRREQQLEFTKRFTDFQKLDPKQIEEVRAHMAAQSSVSAAEKDSEKKAASDSFAGGGSGSGEGSGGAPAENTESAADITTDSACDTKEQTQEPIPARESTDSLDRTSAVSVSEVEMNGFSRSSIRSDRASSNDGDVDSVSTVDHGGPSGEDANQNADPSE